VILVFLTPLVLKIDEFKSLRLCTHYKGVAIYDSQRPALQATWAGGYLIQPAHDLRSKLADLCMFFVLLDKKRLPLVAVQLWSQISRWGLQVKCEEANVTRIELSSVNIRNAKPTPLEIDRIT
jgi:hypothetical protein